MLQALRSASSPRSVLLCGLAFTAACQSPSSPTSSTTSPVVYGDDDREDVYAFADTAWADSVAGFTAAMMSPSTLNMSNPDDIQLNADTLTASFGVCADERFANQLTAGDCSATLIAPDVVLTAGHCISDSTCAGTRFVFDYYMTDETTLQTIGSEDVFSCDSILARAGGGSLDFAVVKLDREATGRTPATVAKSAAALAVGTPLIVNGYPSGLPIKIDDGGAVRDGRADAMDFFVANLDTFGGNSGSGVFDASGVLVGILVRGETDYVDDGGCLRVNVCPEDGCRGEDATYAFRAIEALCETGEGPGTLCSCGDGTCEPLDDETTATCPRDCGTLCGDGTCNGEESPLNCTDDCGTCGNLVCDGDETTGTCCTDCGCDGEDECRDNICVPPPGEGNDCASPLAIDATGTQVITGDTTFALADFAHGCGGTQGRDRVYTFTLTEPTLVEAELTGYDTLMAIRTDCADPGSEVACNDDATPPGDLGSGLRRILDAGTYFLFVDAFSDGAGPYELTIAFSEPLVVPGDRCDAPIALTAAASQVVTGSTVDAFDDFGGSCGGTGANDVVYSLTLTEPAELTAELSGFDTLLHVRSTCNDAGTELACNDDDDAVPGNGSRVVQSLTAGTYFLVVDGFANRSGDYSLRVELTCSEDSDDDGTGDCVDVCPNDPNATDTVPACGCGVADTDSDADGTPDCNDMCATDPAKTEPGTCGCGSADVDTDGDGVFDCADVCPDDAGDDCEGGGCGCSAGTDGAPPAGPALLMLLAFGAVLRRRRT